MPIYSCKYKAKYNGPNTALFPAAYSLMEYETETYIIAFKMRNYGFIIPIKQQKQLRIP